jgi:hypothetical protein
MKAEHDKRFAGLRWKLEFALVIISTGVAMQTLLHFFTPTELRAWFINDVGNPTFLTILIVLETGMFGAGAFGYWLGKFDSMVQRASKSLDSVEQQLIEYRELKARGPEPIDREKFVAYRATAMEAAAEAGYRPTSQEHAAYQEQQTTMQAIRNLQYNLDNEPDEPKNSHVPWPADQPPRFNACDVACDMWTGPCACGAWHQNGK